MYLLRDSRARNAVNNYIQSQMMRVIIKSAVDQIDKNYEEDFFFISVIIKDTKKLLLTKLMLIFNEMFYFLLHNFHPLILFYCINTKNK